MYAALYTRISQDQTGERAGVTRQYDDCAALADRIGATVVAHFDDNDISAFSGKTRPGFESMLDALKRGEIDTIIAWHPDRLYRSMKDLERLIDVVDTGGIEIRTVNGGDLDLSNSTGRMLARILGSVSRQESEHKGERRRRANLQRAAAGQWRSDQPRLFGYTRTGEHLEPEASAIRQAIHDVLAGRSLRSIATDWNERGLLTPFGKPWTNLSVRRVLVKPTHAALRVHQGKVVGKGAWQAIIDEATHRGLVAYLSDPDRKPGSTFERRYQGSGVYRCGVCDGLLYATFPGRTRPMVYACKPTKHVGRAGAPLDELVSTLVLKLLRRADITSRLTPDTPDTGAMHDRRIALGARLDELARLFATGEIDSSQLRSGTTELRSQLAGVDQVLADAVAMSPAVQLLDGEPDELETRWAALPADIKGKIIDELMVVRVLPARRGKGFDPDYIDITPKK